MKFIQPLILIIIITAFFSACESEDIISQQEALTKTSPNLPTKDLFIDMAMNSGLEFIYNTGSTGNLFMAEIVGGGAAFFDCDNDGDLDILFNQGTIIADESKLRDAQPVLYRNNLIGKKPQQGLVFSNITQHSKITVGEYGIGIATGDINNDGYVDFYLTNFGTNRLFVNIGDCQFKEETNQAADQRWSVSASFFDMQKDGLLDLFVGNYVNHNRKYNKTCRNATGQIDYCGPKAYTPQTNSLWRNNGNSQFLNISSLTNIDSVSGGALGVVASDFNGDQQTDIYIANDQNANILWENNVDGSFTNVALISGCAVNSSGLAESSMGVALGDVDNDGNFDLFMTHLRQETNTFFNIKNGMCFDKTNKTDLAAASVPFTGFGTGFLDYDNDGDLDIFVANGEIEMIVEQVKQGDSFPLKQHNQLFENTGLGGFNDKTPVAGKAINRKNVSRGAVFGDIDNDGDLDILVVNSNEKAQLLINTQGQKKNWIGFDVYNDSLNRHAIGSEVEITLNNGSKQIRRVATDGSYASANDPRVLFGLGDKKAILKVKIKWLNGEITTMNNLPNNNYYKILKSSSNAIKL